MRFAILKAGRATRRGREELGDVHGMFKSLLASPGDIWDIHEVREGEFPQRVELYDGIVVTGSPESTYDDLPWIRQLEEKIAQAYQADVPLLGVCFGHQMVAQALGGEVAKNAKGWDLGINRIELTPAGSRLALLQGAPNPIRILELHQDIVTRLPPGAVRLATSEKTEYEMYHLGPKVLGIQGHPEMDNEEVRQIMTKRDWLPQDAVQRGLETLGERPHRDYLQKLMVNFLQAKGLEAAPTIISATG